MKTTNSNSVEDTPKSTQSKSSKKSTKSRAKSSKSELNNSSNNAAGLNNNSMVGTPTTPTTTHSSNLFDSTLGSGGSADTNSSSSRSHHKSFAGLEPRSIKIIWEQHDQSDVELSTEVCTRVAEDASYKLWELVNNIKTYARHSGGVVTYDLVNEVMRDADVPPALGAMDSDWDRIDYDGSYFFYSDKIMELREEYQENVSITLPDGADFKCSWPVEEKNAELLKKYIPSLIYVTLNGDTDALETALSEAAFSPIIGASYRLLLTKLIQIFAFKQTDAISSRCWRLLRACACNPHTRDVDCREEYFHLSEILICQLLAPYESIKVQEPQHCVKTEDEVQQLMQEQTIKMEIDEVKLEQQQQQLGMKSEFMETTQQQSLEQEPFETPNRHTQEEKIYKLHLEEDEDEEIVTPELPQWSTYFASPIIDAAYVSELCETMGHLAVINSFFQSECIFNVTRRLQRFFEGRNVCAEREYNYIGRAVRGLIALGEYAFREFIPFIYKFNVEEVPQSLWNDFALAAVYVKGPDDIFLYEWLEYLCGGDKLQPYMVYYAQYHEKLLTYRYLKRKPPTFRINAKLGVRRLEWNALAAAMCHGDDPNLVKPKPTLQEAFPELATPNLQLNRAGTIRFKFAGCRPIIIKQKSNTTPTAAISQIKAKPESLPINTTGGVAPIAQADVLIARRKLFKPLTNERRIVPLSSYYFVRI